MKVKELMERLQGFNEELEVLVINYGDDPGMDEYSPGDVVGRERGVILRI